MFWMIAGRILAAVAIVVAGWVVASWLAGLVRNGLERSRLDPVVRRLVVQAVAPTGLVIVVVATAEWLGLHLTGALVVLAGAAAAVALGTRDTASHAAAGAVLLTLRPYDARDRVQIAGEEGTVVDVGLLATRLRTDDGTEIVVPNGLVLARPIRNVTRTNAPEPAAEPQNVPTGDPPPRERKPRGSKARE